MKKVIVFILCLLLVGCNTKANLQSEDIFDREKASYVAQQYMDALSKKDVGKADSLCKDLVIPENEVKKLDDNRFKAYKIKELDEGADYVRVRYLVIRGNDIDIRADLDSIELKIDKIDDYYKITEVEAKNIKQVYLDGENLRIIDREIGKSDLILRKRDLPREIFAKGDKVTLTMDSVPDVNFNHVNVGFQGNSLGLTLSNGEKTLLVYSTINDIKKSGGEIVSMKSGENTEDILEKPVADKIIGYDLINAGSVEKVLFTDNDEALIIQVKEAGKGDSVRIYKNPSGELMDLKLNEKFPSNEYSVGVEKVTEDGIYVKSTGLNGNKDEEGIYLVDIENKEVSKQE